VAAEAARVAAEAARVAAAMARTNEYFDLAKILHEVCDKD
jgi:hypothetical protein